MEGSAFSGLHRSARCPHRYSFVIDDLRQRRLKEVKGVLKLLWLIGMIVLIIVMFFSVVYGKLRRAGALFAIDAVLYFAWLVFVND